MNQLVLPMNHELVVDLFAGGGGASTGIELATGKFVDAAINHDPVALGMHELNHPQTKHFCSDIFEVEPKDVTNGRPVGLLWASPDCKHFSKAKGGKPVDKKIRALAWVVVKWAKKANPRVIFVENVEEFADWGPLVEVAPGKFRPDKTQKGVTFKEWVSALEELGYKVEWKILRACDYGAPTIRKRLFIVARRDGKPIVWPAPTHGDPAKAETKKKGLKPWLTAASCIDWSLPCPSIFERKKPLAEATLKRIARGLEKFVINNPKPFIVSIANWSNETINDIEKPLTTVTANPKGGHHALVMPIIATNTTGHPGAPLDKPLCTVTTGGHHALVTPFLVTTGYGERKGQKPRIANIKKPLWTVVSQSSKTALVTAFLDKRFTGATGAAVSKPMPTVTTKDHNQLITSYAVKLRGKCVGHSMTEPLHTISAGGTHLGEVRAFLVKYYSNEKDGANLNEPMPTITTKDRMGVVCCHIDGEPYAIVDIGMRMLQPHELYAAQGFPSGRYKIDMLPDGKPLSKSAQVRLCGNSVSPKAAAALVAANFTDTPQA